LSVRGDSLLVAWQERSLAAAAADSVKQAATHAHDASMYVNAVGAMQVVTRRGVLATTGGGQ
jgi:hypothetical protein